jgi:hypothetical protein
MPFSSAVVAARLQGFLEQDRQGELEYNRGAALTRVHRDQTGGVVETTWERTIRYSVRAGGERECTVLIEGEAHGLLAVLRPVVLPGDAQLRGWADRFFDYVAFSLWGVRPIADESRQAPPGAAPIGRAGEVRRAPAIREPGATRTARGGRPALYVIRGALSADGVDGPGSLAR